MEVDLWNCLGGLKNRWADIKGFYSAKCSLFLSYLQKTRVWILFLQNMVTAGFYKHDGPYSWIVLVVLILNTFSTYGFIAGNMGLEYFCFQVRFVIYQWNNQRIVGLCIFGKIGYHYFVHQHYYINIYDYLITHFQSNSAADMSTAWHTLVYTLYIRL